MGINNFKSLDEEPEQEAFPYEEMHLKIANDLHSFRKIGDLFGNFLYQITHLFVVFFGGKPK